MIIAIDGPAGSGKSTVAKLVARELGFGYLDTGAMYRAVAWQALEQGIDLSDPLQPTSQDAIRRIAQEDPISFGFTEGEPLPSTVLIAGKDVTAQIRTPEADRAVSAVSADPEVRAALTEQQRQLAATHDMVLEGRDIGTVVLPDADCKVFLIASAGERALRRALQNAAKQGRDNASAEEVAAVLADIERRDAYDSARECAPLVAAADAWELDSTAMSIDEVVAAIVERAKRKRKRKPKFDQINNSWLFFRPLNHFFDTPCSGKGHFSQKFFTLIKFLIFILYKPLFRYKAIDRKLFDSSYNALVKEQGKGFMMVGNHHSYSDPIFVMGNICPHPIRYITKEEFFDVNLIVARMTAWLGAFPIKRNTADMTALKRAVRMLKRGEIVGIFPEGTRVRRDDQEVRHHEGVALIASMAKAPVIPFRLWNTEKIMPEGEKGMRCPTVYMRFGEMISIEEPRFAELPKEQRYTAFTEAVMAAVHALEMPEKYVQREARKEARAQARAQARAAKKAAKAAQ